MPIFQQEVFNKETNPELCYQTLKLKAFEQKFRIWIQEQKKKYVCQPEAKTLAREDMTFQVC